MKSWRKNFWPSEMKQLIVEILKNGDMTLKELTETLKNTGKIKIHYAAIASLIRVTDGVYVKCKVFSETSKKMVNVYSIGFAQTR
jgi:transposase